MNPQEIRKQKFDQLKKKTIQVFTTALRMPLMLMTGCGYVTVAKTFMGQPAEVHDHDGKKMVHINFDKVPYDESIHGKIYDFLEEGQELPGESNSTEGKKRIHRHNRFRGSGGTAGAHEYSYE